MKKILVIDDEPDILKVVTMRILKAGYQLLMAADGSKGLELAKMETISNIQVQRRQLYKMQLVTNLVQDNHFQ